MSSRDSRSASLRASESVPSGHPDAIFINGNFITADAAFSVANAVAVRDGRFLAVGSTDDIRSMAGPSTSIVDLNGATVLPGLIDTHAHVERAGLLKHTVQLNDVSSAAQALAAHIRTRLAHAKGPLDPRRAVASDRTARGKALSHPRGTGSGGARTIRYAWRSAISRWSIRRRWRWPASQRTRPTRTAASFIATRRQANATARWRKPRKISSTICCRTGRTTSATTR